jgi:site-specific DNA recombinase
MKTCAIYARKSTDDSDRNEEARSVTRQVEHATAYAQAHGWTVSPQHVYVDDNASGAEWTRRHGLNRLLAAIETGRPPFSVLIVSELSRIGRDSVRVPYIVQRIEEAGVEIHGYLSGQRISVDDELGEMQTMLHSLAASYERRRAKQRTHDALLRRARAGYIANGICFGYHNAPVLEGGRRLHSMRVIEPAEAAVVVRIFEMCAAGSGYGKIAHILNDAGAPAPSPRRPGRRRSWSTTTVRDALMREAYRGAITWNVRRREMRHGRRAATRRPPGEWVARQDESLRIVSEELWTARTRAWPPRAPSTSSAPGTPTVAGRFRARSRRICWPGSSRAAPAAAPCSRTATGRSFSRTCARSTTCAAGASAKTAWGPPWAWRTRR